MEAEGFERDQVIERLGAERAADLEAELSAAGLVVVPAPLYERLLLESARYRRLAAIAMGEEPE